MKQNSTKILEKNKTVRLYRYMRGCILEINHEGLKWARLPFCWSNLGVDNILWKVENSRIKRTWFWNRAWDTCCRACLFFFFFFSSFSVVKSFWKFFMWSFWFVYLHTKAVVDVLERGSCFGWESGLPEKIGD